MRAAAKYLTHHAEQLQRALVADPIEDPVGILAGAQDAFVAQDREMLRDIALRRSHRIDNVLDAEFPLAQYTQDLQTQRMRHGLDDACGLLDVLFPLDQFRAAADAALQHENPLI